jgi:hypothetical protein
MAIRRLAGATYAVISAGVIVFELALAAGAPWGAYAMGGAFPGQYPPAMRVAAIVQAVILVLMAAVILSRAGLALPSWSRVARWLAWVIVAFLAVGVVLNLITPSAGERLIWAPVALLLFICSFVVALGKPA